MQRMCVLILLIFSTASTALSAEPCHAQMKAAVRTFSNDTDEFFAVGTTHVALLLAAEARHASSVADNAADLFYLAPLTAPVHSLEARGHIRSKLLFISGAALDFLLNNAATVTRNNRDPNVAAAATAFRNHLRSFRTELDRCVKSELK